MCGVEELAWGPIRLAEIMFQSAFKPNHLGNDPRQFSDRDFVSGANIDRFKSVAKSQQMDQRIGQIIHMEKFTQRRATAPQCDLILAGKLCFVNASHQCRQNMRRQRIEIVVWPVEIGWHCRHEVMAKLSCAGLSIFESRNLGNRIGFVVGSKGPVNKAFSVMGCGASRG